MVHIICIIFLFLGIFSISFPSETIENRFEHRMIYIKKLKISLSSFHNQTLFYAALEKVGEAVQYEGWKNSNLN